MVWLGLVAPVNPHIAPVERRGRVAGLLLALLACGRAAAGNPGDEPAAKYFPALKRPSAPELAARAPAKGGPIILIIVDALRPLNLTPYGYARPTSPKLKAFADEGLIFTHFFANAPWTRPATTTILTGQLPTNHRVQCDWDKLPSEVGTFAESLRRAGYKTIAVVGNGNVSSAFGLNRGFDIYEDTSQKWRDLPTARQVFELGVRHLERHRRQKKLFLLLFIIDTHDPYEPEPPYDRLFDPAGRRGLQRPRWEIDRDLPEETRRRIVAQYDGLIRYTDDQLGWLFGRLRKLGLWNKASIFITADHGESFGEHGLYLHSFHHYESHLRIPLLIRAPWIRPMARGSFSPAFLAQIDLAPTFLALAGAKQPPDMRGFDIVKLLRKQGTDLSARYLISEYKCYGIHRAAIRTRRYKLIYQQPADRQAFLKTVGDPALLPSVSFDREVFELYDVLADPFETADLWPTLGETTGQKLLGVLRTEIEQQDPSRRVRDLDPALVEQLRSLGYMQ